MEAAVMLLAGALAFVGFFIVEDFAVDFASAVPARPALAFLGGLPRFAAVVPVVFVTLAWATEVGVVDDVAILRGRPLGLPVEILGSRGFPLAAPFGGRPRLRGATLLGADFLGAIAAPNVCDGVGLFSFQKGRYTRKFRGGYRDIAGTWKVVRWFSLLGERTVRMRLAT